MHDDQIVSEFRDAEALLQGHFILSSGRHSSVYLQCARVLMRPSRAERLSAALVENIPEELRSRVTVVVSPAMGGVIAGHEVARQIDADAMFLERPSGVFELRRGFELHEGDGVLLVEDVVTTGLSSREAIAVVQGYGAEVIAASSFVDRSNGTADVGVPFFPLLRLPIETYDPDAVPEWLAAIPPLKPGSRK